MQSRVIYLCVIFLSSTSIDWSFFWYAHIQSSPVLYLQSAANSHGCIAIVRHLKLEDKIEIVNAYGKTRTPEFLAINPCHTCPTLELDGDDGAIWESCAIMRYLCLNNDGGEELYPADPVLRGKIDMVME